MKPINIRKQFNLKESSIEIRFNGIPTKEVNLDEINVLLDDFINNHIYISMLDFVIMLRTILRNFDERLLVVSYQDEQTSEYVEYYDTNLFLYEKNRKQSNDDGYKITYYSTNGLKINYNNSNVDVNYKNVEVVSDDISDMMMNIYYLKDAKAKVLDTDDKLLIEIYKVFYNENPDFSSPDINNRIQSMMSILLGFGIYIDDSTGFILSGENNTPVSYDLRRRVNRLYPFGVVNKTNIKLAEEPKFIIKSVRDSIDEMMDDDSEFVQKLIAISKIIYVKKYCVSTDSDIDKISKFTNSTSNEVESSMKLVKHIESKIKNQSIKD